METFCPSSLSKHQNGMVKTDSDNELTINCAYKYLGVLEGDEIKHTQMKRRIEAEYFRRVRKY